MSTSDDQKTVAFILTSHNQKGENGEATGFHLSEAAHPWAVLNDAGIAVRFASIAGGKPPIDGQDAADSDPVCRAFLQDSDVQQQLADTPTADALIAQDIDAVFYVGGHGTMWDFPDNPQVQELARAVWSQGGALAAVCHGPSGLVNLKDNNGDYIVNGKRIAAFTDAEEQAVGLADVVPFLLASTLQARGAIHVPADNWAENVVVDGRLITGQNPASAHTLGIALRDALLA